MNAFRVLKYIALSFTFMIMAGFPVSGLNGSDNNDTRIMHPKAEGGVLDLRQWDFEEYGPVNLDGEWEFFWKEFLVSEAGSRQNYIEPSGFLTLPGYWNNYMLDGEALSSEGYASYRLRILLPEDNDKTYSFILGDILTSYSLYTDGVKIAETGTTGTSRETSVPDLSVRTAQFFPEGRETEIILEVSNFYDRKSGVWGSIEFGPSEEILRVYIKRVSIDVIIMTGIFIMGLYHIGLFLLGRKDKPALFFGLFCLFITARALTTGERALYQIMPNLPWSVLLRIEFLSFFLAAPIFLKYLQSLFSDDFFKPVFRISFIAGLAFCLTLFFPVRIFAYMVEPCQLVILLAGLYSIYVLIRAIYHKREGASIILTGFIILFATVLNDVMYTNEIINTGFYIPAGLLAFIFSQAFLIALRANRMFITIETQKEKLQESNTAYSHELVERKKLEKNLIESHEKFERSRLGIIMGLAKLAEYRDEDTGAHLERIREYSKVLAERVAKNPEYRGYITESYINDLFQSSILHDIGKVGVPDSILLKPARLTDEEFNQIKRHTSIGGEAIANVEAKINIKSFLTLGREIAYSHHEKWDGSGYPRGIRGKDIPLSARITALADVYDALRSERPYKDAFSHEKTKEIILEGKGSHFDPDIVDAFISGEEDFLRIQRDFLDA